MEDANALLDSIRPAIGKAREINETLSNMSAHLKELASIWGQDIFSEKNPDNKYYYKRLSEREKLAEQLENTLSTIAGTGAVIKDVESGLVDFYFDNNGQIIFLCWKWGEAKIEHWHPLSSGAVGRRRIEELLMQA